MAQRPACCTAAVPLPYGIRSLPYVGPPVPEVRQSASTTPTLLLTVAHKQGKYTCGGFTCIIVAGVPLASGVEAFEGWMWCPVAHGEGNSPCWCQPTTCHQGAPAAHTLTKRPLSAIRLHRTGKHANPTRQRPCVLHLPCCHHTPPPAGHRPTARLHRKHTLTSNSNHPCLLYVTTMKRAGGMHHRHHRLPPPTS